ncbi:MULTISPECIES: Na+/H+ antiporter NhaA [Micrococcaceae]|uniref:Na(+)/H(+) antiporter NhaA n=1 Tax=Arthrobacter rhombi TaxID=71253 RepID=A0A1R4GUG5_9MICC|nr:MULTISPECIES: Na+/H+ antiporter NhaA [Micrococcaceae]PCC25767.1 Na+/H+ antiporter NhaA [Glutamicibacter sp. BW78]SJM71735.1 Na+/H+ antiporter NhaA type [Arthrobacter rhombi]
MTNPEPAPPRQTILGLGSYRESQRIGAILRKETVGGLVLIVAAAVAIIWANTPWGDSYFALRDLHLNIPVPWIDLDLSLGHWASDGLLAVFFFLVGLELKKEFVIGDLRDFSKAIVPVTAAFGGVLIPALIYVALNISEGGSTLHGWAIPTATDIAFAVAVLAVIGSSLPSPLRIFLLTLAVVDDLIAIMIIAIVYTDTLDFLFLGLALIPLALFFFISHRYQKYFATRAWTAWVILLPLGIVTWAFVLQSGIHATVAGVLLGFSVPVLRHDKREGTGVAERFEHRFRPLSSGFCVPIFAFFSAGVAIGGVEGITKAMADPVVWGIVAGLVLGKPIGILGSTFLLTKTRHANLDPAVRWVDLLGVTLLAGIGFTVSLLVSELSFGLESPHYEHAKVAILTGSLLAAVLGAAWLIPRNRRYRKWELEAQRDDDADGIPDVYQQD